MKFVEVLRIYRFLLSEFALDFSNIGQYTVEGDRNQHNVI